MIPIITVLVLLVAAYVVYKIVKGIVSNVILVVLIAIVFLIVSGSIPQVKSKIESIPFVGGLLSKAPTMFGFAEMAWKLLYNVEIMDPACASDNNLLITVKNSGRLDVSGIKVLVNDKDAGVTNKPSDPLKSGQSTTIQTDHNAGADCKGFEKIEVKTDQASATYLSE